MLFRPEIMVDFSIYVHKKIKILQLQQPITLKQAWWLPLFQDQYYPTTNSGDNPTEMNFVILFVHKMAIVSQTSLRIKIAPYNNLLGLTFVEIQCWTPALYTEIEQCLPLQADSIRSYRKKLKASSELPLQWTGMSAGRAHVMLKYFTDPFRT